MVGVVEYMFSDTFLLFIFCSHKLLTQSCPLVEKQAFKKAFWQNSLGGNFLPDLTGKLIQNNWRIVAEIFARNGFVSP